MRAREFLDEVARPNVTDLAADFGNIRKALNAIHAVDALAAYIYNDVGRKSGTGAKDDSEFRGKLAGQNPDFRLLWDLAKAAKHVVRDRGAPIVSTAEQVKAASLGLDVGHWDEFRWDGPPQAVVITDAGDHRSIEALFRGLSISLRAKWLVEVSDLRPAIRGTELRRKNDGGRVNPPDIGGEKL